MLASLPGISVKLAQNIYDGVDTNNKKTLKPYQHLGDLFKVQGISPDVFERCINILTNDSSVFIVEIEVQTLKAASKKQSSDSGEVLSSRKKRFTIELDKRTDGFFNITERERCPVKLN